MMRKQFDIVVARLDTISASAAILSESERQRAWRFTFERDRKRFIAARATLRSLLAARLGVRPEEVEMVYGKYGKPALGVRFASSELRFNVSHCDDLAVYAFARGRDVGVDVEAVRWFADAGDVAARFFSQAENEAYAALDSLEKPSGFFNCWTRKEAFIKAIGDGLNHPLQSFDARRIRGWEIESFVPAPGFIAAIATEKP
jgi:4'-phosphopantetheinyl transferase